MKFYPENLPRWIKTIEYWRATDVGLECVLDIRGNQADLPGFSTTGLDLYGHRVTHLIPRANIDAIHEGLFERLRNMSEAADIEDRDAKSSMDTLNSFMLRTAYAHLTDAVVVDDVRDCQRNVAEFIEVVSWAKEERSVCFHAHIFRKETTKLFGKDNIEYVYGATTNRVFPTGSWLDKNFPGWEGRLQAAIDLGCTPTELVAAVFTHQPKLSLEVNLPTSDLTSYTL